MFSKIRYAAVAGTAFALTGCAPPPPHQPEDYYEPVRIVPDCHEARSSYRDTKDVGFTLMLGIGFEDSDIKIFKIAAARWTEKTGLPIEVTSGHGMKGNVHIFDELYVCGDQIERERSKWHEDHLGCYQDALDRIAYSRPGIHEFTDRLVNDSDGAALSPEEQYRQVLFFVYLHHIGHWLGIKGELDANGNPTGHVKDGEKSVMVASPLQAFLGSSSLSKRVWKQDALAACMANVCPENWCHEAESEE